MKGAKAAWLLWVMLLCGALIGGALWQLLTPVLPGPLGASLSVGSTNGPWNIDLNLISFTFGLVLNLNIGGILGAIIALFVWFKI